MLIDAIAMVGTNPTTMFVLKKIYLAEVSQIKATVVIQSAVKSIKTPSVDHYKISKGNTGSGTEFDVNLSFKKYIIITAE